MHTFPLEICRGRENLHESWPCGCSPSRACHAPPSISFREALWGGPALPSLGHCTVLSGSVVSDSLQPHGLQPTRLLCLWGFSRQEYWSELPFPSPGNLPNLFTAFLPSKNAVMEILGTYLQPCSLPHSSVHRIFQARILAWVAISFSRGSS